MKSNKLKLLLSTFVVMSFFILLNISYAASAELENLDITMNLNSDGSMDVEEVWHVDMENTNTLFKNYTKNDKRYSGISNVKVYEVLADNSLREFKQSYIEEKKVKDNYFYSLFVNKNIFEIAWGTGNSYTGTKKYKIQYTVNDLVKIYSDTADIFWPILGDKFELKIKKINGSINLPKIDAKEYPEGLDLKSLVRTWAHGPLQGNIHIISENRIEFNVPNYNSNEFVELRVIAPKFLFRDTPLTEDKDMFLNIIEEERELTERANRVREAKKKIVTIVIDLLLIVTGVFGIILITRIFKYKEILRDINKILPSQKLDYFREVPRKDATPAEALFVSNLFYLDFSYSLSPIISATLLNLSIKKYIEFNLDEKNKVKILLLKDADTRLKKHEQMILELLNSSNKKEEKIVTMKELQKNIEKTFADYTKLKNFTNAIETDIKQNLEKDYIYIDEDYKKAKHWYDRYILYLLLFIFTLPIIYLSIPALICSILCKKILNNNMGLTQAGVDEKEKWKAFKKYMEDFSLLKEKEVPSIVIWEEFLVYATAFGIADKVIKQLKISYPNFTNETSFAANSYMYLLASNNSNFNFISSLNTSIGTSFSSGAGYGGGFSGGAGGSGVSGGGGAR